MSRYRGSVNKFVCAKDAICKVCQMQVSNTQNNNPADGADRRRCDMPEFLPLRELLGHLISQWREKSETSLRELQARSGVSDSEISRIEKGGQDCRLESFIRICAALGLPAGFILDNAVAFALTSFETGVKDHPLILEIANKNKGLIDVLSQNVSAFAAFAAKLLISSRPLENAAAPRYFNRELEARFIDLGHYLDDYVPPQKRLAFLLALKARPVDTLAELRLISSAILRELAEPLLLGKTTNPVLRHQTLGIVSRDNQSPLWIQSDLTEEALAPKNDLTETLTQPIVEVVKPLWPALKKRLQSATAETGKKSELANFLKLDLTRVSQWLTDGKSAREPGAEYALQMLHWVEHQEQK